MLATLANRSIHGSFILKEEEVYFAIKLIWFNDYYKNNNYYY